MSTSTTSGVAGPKKRSENAVVAGLGLDMPLPASSQGEEGGERDLHVSPGRQDGNGNGNDRNVDDGDVLSFAKRLLQHRQGPPSDRQLDDSRDRSSTGSGSGRHVGRNPSFERNEIPPYASSPHKPRSRGYSGASSSSGSQRPPVVASSSIIHRDHSYDGLSTSSPSFLRRTTQPSSMPTDGPSRWHQANTGDDGRPAHPSASSSLEKEALAKLVSMYESLVSWRVLLCNRLAAGSSADGERDTEREREAGEIAFEGLGEHHRRTR